LLSEPKRAARFSNDACNETQTHRGTLRAAKQFRQSTAEIINHESGVRERVELLENIISEAADLIEIRSPEPVAHASAPLRRDADETPRAAE
jgi:hypothetical protein